MFSSDKVRILLLEEFIKAQARNPHYSMRAYARKLGVGQSAVSEILSGKRPITKKAAVKILDGLGKNPDEASQILAEAEGEAPQKFRSLDMDSFHLISEWYYYGILSLTETKDFKGSEPEISQRLGISASLTQEAVERLIRLDMLERDPKTGKLKATGEQFEAVSQVANPALKKANRRNLEMALEVLDQTEHEERDYSAITLCFDPDRMEDARKMLRNFRRQFCKVMESGHKKEVYKLNLQLFPLSKRRQK
jgi:uncharacterized protein (TIGR02147 family)